MIEVIVKFEVDERPVEPDEIEDEYLAEMLAHTGDQLRQQVAHKLGEMRCDEHGGQPRVTVTGSYTTDTEQMELAYHVDTCCPALLLRAVGALNH